MIVCGAVAYSQFASYTCAVNCRSPTVVGVPVIAPVLPFRLSPGGRAPTVILQAYGNVPPVAVRVAEYGSLLIPTGSEVVVIETVVIVIVNDALAVSIAASVTCTVKDESPAVVGVPVIAPAELRLNPAGSDPLITAQV